MKTLYRQLLASMLVISIALPLIVLVSFNVAMSNNVEKSAKAELNNTVKTMHKLIETSSTQDNSSTLLQNLVAALTSTKLSGNTNFYIVRNNKIRFRSENDFNVKRKIVKSIAKGQEEIYTKKINNTTCYVYKVSLDKYEGVTNASMVFITNTKESTENLKNTNVLLISIIMVCVVISIIYSISMASGISAPIKAACIYANEVGNGIWTKEIHVSSSEEIEELYESLNQMAKKLKENDESQKSFYQNISHEFRNPLMSIQGYAEGIEQGILIDNAQAAAVIKQESLKLNELVTELLTLSRMDSKVYELEMEEYHIMDLMVDYVQRLNGIAINNNVEIKMNVDEKMVVKIDESLFARAVTNVISNCIKYAESTVYIEGYKTDNNNVIEIYDDGCGTDEASMPHLFERFYKGEHGNFGLGLAIAKEAIETMDGVIDVYNPDDEVVDGKKKIRFRISFLLTNHGNSLK